MVVRCILKIMIFLLSIMGCCAVNGIIWLKQKQEFVQLFSIPQFAALQEEHLAKHRAVEILDMKNVVVRAVYYEEKNMVMFYDNDTKVNGICGDLWYILADYLNFTFIPMKTTDRDFGEKLENGSYTGVIGMLSRNEAQVIMRTGFFLSRMDVMDYTTALWKSQFHIYVQPDWLFDNRWVLTLFSPTTWYSVVFLFIILSFVGYFLQKIPIDYEKETSVNFSLNDHFFYSFAMMCGQGYIPDAFQNKFKILSLSKIIFAWLVLLAFSSHLIYRMTNREPTLPFKDVDTLFSNTKKTLLAFRGSIIYYYLHDKYGTDVNRKHLLSRVRFIEIAEDMHNLICDNMNKYAMFEIDDRFMALNRNDCPLTALGNYNDTYISFAVQKNYPYKKTIDYALIKFYEVGIMDALKDRWLEKRVENIEQVQFKMIDLNQVYLIFMLLCWGALISFVILVLENTMNGIIWSKLQKTFVPISSIPIFAMIQQERYRQSRALETHNFQLQNLTVTSFKEEYFFEFYDNNTKVKGVCGETWNLLSELLNFTLQPVRVYINDMGVPEENGTYKDGLLGIISRNETIILPRVDTFVERIMALDFTVPFGINSYHLYIRREVIHDNEWMIRVFSWEIWYIILIMYMLISVCTFLTQHILGIWNKDKYQNTPFNEHLFYNFGNLCTQSYIPEFLSRKSRILEVSLSFFCFLTYTAFSAVLFIYVTKNVYVPPFHSVSSLIANTKYSIISLKGSTGAMMFKAHSDPQIVQARKTKRLIIISTIEKMEQLACFSQKKKYALYQGEDEHKMGKYVVCNLIPTGRPLEKIWAASGIVKNFKYKRTIDLGILKLKEVGLLNVLKDRWLGQNIKQDFDDNNPQPIELYQVSLVITVLCCGMIIAFIIFIIEKIVFVYKLKQL
ncbi:uncharacterized protein [Anoplolepis gracilipes]|uniref:uncharacterized protein n=1 Tax=Anoplolepis gracilipes TaxID=354296 RepID=UPI003B9FBAB5